MLNKTIYEGEYSRALREYGLEHLTGESCAIGLRILYDMNVQGLKLVEEALSIKIDRSRTPKNWNSVVNGYPAIASIKLSHSQAKDLLVFALSAMYRFVVVVTVKTTTERFSFRPYIYATDSREDLDEIVTIIDKNEWYYRRVYQTYDSQPKQGLDNVHAFSGRAT